MAGSNNGGTTARLSASSPVENNPQEISSNSLWISFPGITKKVWFCLPSEGKFQITIGAVKRTTVRKDKLIKMWAYNFGRSLIKKADEFTLSFSGNYPWTL